VEPSANFFSAPQHCQRTITNPCRSRAQNIAVASGSNASKGTVITKLDFRSKLCSGCTLLYSKEDRRKQHLHTGTPPEAGTEVFPGDKLNDITARTWDLRPLRKQDGGFPGRSIHCCHSGRTRALQRCQRAITNPRNTHQGSRTRAQNIAVASGSNASEGTDVTKLDFRSELQSCRRPCNTTPGN